MTGQTPRPTIALIQSRKIPFLVSSDTVHIEQCEGLYLPSQRTVNLSVLAKLTTQIRKKNPATRTVILVDETRPIPYPAVDQIPRNILRDTPAERVILVAPSVCFATAWYIDIEVFVLVADGIASIERMHCVPRDFIWNRVLSLAETYP